MILLSKLEFPQKQPAVKNVLVFFKVAEEEAQILYDKQSQVESEFIETMAPITILNNVGPVW